jgi:hypothetical protein
MGTKRLQPWGREAWALSRRQHGVVTRAQLLALGMPAETIRGRIERGHLHPLWPGVYAVGRRDLDDLGRFKAATLACGALPLPTAQERLGRYRVDFFWSDRGLVVEADSLRHHRTAAQQATDIERDQAHVRAGLRALRFTHFQVFHRPDYVRAVLAATLGR